MSRSQDDDASRAGNGGSTPPASAQPRPFGARGLLASAMITTVVVVPMFLLGGMSVLIRRDLGFGEAALGVSAASFFAATSLFSPFGGRLAERIGARRGMLLAAATSASALLGAATLARSWAGLTLCMLLAGAGNGLGQPSSNLALARGVAPGRQGVAFGLKQGAIPLAALLVGVALPVIGLTYGWRWAFIGASLGALAVALLVPKLPPGQRRTTTKVRSGDAPLGALIVLALAALLATMATQTIGTFLVESSVSAGIVPQRAGLLLGAVS